MVDHLHKPRAPSPLAGSTPSSWPLGCLPKLWLHPCLTLHSGDRGSSGSFQCTYWQ